MTPQEEAGAVVTLREMYQDIKALRDDMSKIVALGDNLAQRSLDHETRIRELEKTTATSDTVAKHEERLDAIDRRHWYASGAIAVIAVLVPNISDLIRVFGG